MELTEDDVIEILKLFEHSKFDFLQLQQGERKITVSKGGYVLSGTGAAPAPAPAAASAPQPPAPQTGAKAEAAPMEEGVGPGAGPMGGEFYAAASPSDPPYVEKGTKVAAGATVGLIEVMK